MTTEKTESPHESHTESANESTADRRPTDSPQDIASLIEQYRASAAEVMASDPALAKSKLAKARYLQKGLLRIVLDSERERYREAIADPWKRYKYQFGWHVENTRALIQLSQSALRAAALVNAGAAVAILAFLGNTWDSDIDVSPFAKSLYWFAAGVLSATAAAGAAYFSQLLYGVQDESKQKRGRVPHAVTIALYLAAIAMFGRGCWLTYNAFICGAAKGDRCHVRQTESPTTTTTV